MSRDEQERAFDKLVQEAVGADTIVKRVATPCTPQSESITSYESSKQLAECENTAVFTLNNESGGSAVCIQNNDVLINRLPSVVEEIPTVSTRAQKEGEQSIRPYSPISDAEITVTHELPPATSPYTKSRRVNRVSRMKAAFRRLSSSVHQRKTRDTGVEEADFVWRVNDRSFTCHCPCLGYSITLSRLA